MHLNGSLLCPFVLSLLYVTIVKSDIHSKYSLVFLSPSNKELFTGWILRRSTVSVYAVYEAHETRHYSEFSVYLASLFSLLQTVKESEH